MRRTTGSSTPCWSTGSFQLLRPNPRRDIADGFVCLSVALRPRHAKDTAARSVEHGAVSGDMFRRTTRISPTRFTSIGRIAVEQAGSVGKYTRDNTINTVNRK